MLSKEEAKGKVKLLIAEFELYKKSPNFSDIHIENKTKDWIDALFGCLGWNIKTETSKEQITGNRKRVDYAFRVNGTIKFLLEAKDYNENLDDHIEQALEYGYQRTIKWVVLSNFKEIRIYNSQYYGEPEEVMRLFKPISIDQLLERFDDLWLLSKIGIEEKLIEKTAEKYGKVRPKEPITILLSTELNRWRELLTKDVIQNKNLHSIPEEKDKAEIYIDEAVQRILDRILFIRVAEDREIEEPILEQLLKDHNTKIPLYKKLKTNFRNLDDIYNSGLFKEHYSEDLSLSDSVLIKVISETYKSPSGLKYNFDAINADILGSVYEQYLTILLRKTAKRASLKESHSEKKKQGIYYTPTFIVEYIVRNTIGELLKNKKVSEISKVKILDPACGSGSFLIKSFDEFRLYYQKNFKQQRILKFSEILTQNIYGIDMDTKAVEIASLNLLLKVSAKKEKLPELNEHILCANSLLHSEPLEQWKDGEFYKIVNGGGFDVIIGNPPYVDSEEMTKTQPAIREIYSKLYPYSAVGNWDLFCIFLDRGLSILKTGGYMGMIVPNKLLSADYAESIRKNIGRYKIMTLRDYSKVSVFKDADVYPIVITIQKLRPDKDHKIHIETIESENDELKIVYSNDIKQSDIKSESKHNWSYYLLNESGSEIIDLIKKDSKNLGDGLAEVSGAATVSEAYEIKKILNDSGSEDSFKFINTGTIDRYVSLWGIKKTKYIKSNYIKPTIAKNDLKNLAENRYQQASKTKIIIAGMSKILEAYLDDGKYSAGKSTTIVIPKINPKLLLAILNSKLMAFYYKITFKSLALAGGYMNISSPQIELLPIKIPSKETELKITKLVDEIIELKRELETLTPNSDKWEHFKVKIALVDDKIDEEINKLYGLNEGQVNIIKNSQSSEK